MVWEEPAEHSAESSWMPRDWEQEVALVAVLAAVAYKGDMFAGLAGLAGPAGIAERAERDERAELVESAERSQSMVGVWSSTAVVQVQQHTVVLRCWYAGLE